MRPILAYFWRVDVNNSVLKSLQMKSIVNVAIEGICKQCCIVLREMPNSDHASKSTVTDKPLVLDHAI